MRLFAVIHRLSRLISRLMRSIRPPASVPLQEELPLSSIAAHKLFPGRTVLRVKEVAKVLGVTENQVIDLIEEGRIAAVNIGSGVQSEANPNGNKTERRFWRIPVSAYDAFIAASSNTNPT